MIKMKAIELLQKPLQELKSTTKNIHGSTIYRRGLTRRDHQQELIMCSPHVKEIKLSSTLHIWIQSNCCRGMVCKCTWRSKVNMSETLERGP
jgi:hypothetical protein